MWLKTNSLDEVHEVHEVSNSNENHHHINPYQTSYTRQLMDYFELDHERTRTQGVSSEAAGGLTESGSNEEERR